MVEHGSLHEISQAIGALQGEFRASQRATEDHRNDIKHQLTGIDASVAALARVTTNFEAMRTEYHERFGNIAGSMAEHEVRLRSSEKQLGEIEARYRVNGVWIASIAALIGGAITATVNYLMGKH